MRKIFLNSVIRYCIAGVWAINGLYCKVLGGVPRHRQIVARILGDGIAPLAVLTIGLLEIAMAVWIVSRIRSVWCAAVQIAVILTMNVIEFVSAPDLLLFGRWNACVAIVFCLIIYLQAFRSESLNRLFSKP